MSSLKSRVDKLYTGTISEVTSRIFIMKDEKEIKKVSYGTNKNKVIEIQVKL